MIHHIHNLEYDKDILLLESEYMDYTPYENGYNDGSWFSHAPSWLQGHVKDEKYGGEVFRVLNNIKTITGVKDIRPRFYKQKENTEVPMHADIGTQCSINIVLSDNAGPICFEGHGEFTYSCAVLDVTKRHSVPAYPEERILLKYSIFDYGYEYVCMKFSM